jgi:aminomethyltransferase
MAEPSGSTEPLLNTPFNAIHRALGARMVPFAGYDMPVQYPTGVMAEHKWTREQAGLFDVSHMGIAYLHAADGQHETVARALETLVPADILGLAPGQQRYSQLLNADGGILDDLMVARSADPAHAGWLYLVVNAACKTADYAHIAAHLPAGVSLLPSDQFALVALQGPLAVDVLADHDPRVRTMGFMTAGVARIGGVEVHLTRSGYTGEDGFELPLPLAEAERLWNVLSADPRVRPIGLGARDSLRLEGGLCLYGHDIDTTTSPIEAGLAWSIQKRRRIEGGFPGAARIQRELAEGPARRRVGLLPEGRAPAREGTEIRTRDGALIGTVTSGGFGPTLNAPIAMGYIDAAHAALDTPVDLIVRGKPLPARVAALPFVPNRFVRSPKA